MRKHKINLDDASLDKIERKSELSDAPEQQTILSLIREVRAQRAIVRTLIDLPVAATSDDEPGCHDAWHGGCQTCGDEPAY